MYGIGCIRDSAGRCAIIHAWPASAAYYNESACGLLLSNIKSVAMKLPSGQQIPSPPSQPTPGTARPAGATEPGREAVAASARQLLDQVQLANRETTLARVAEVISRQSGRSAEVLLDIRGKSLLVQACLLYTSPSPRD